MRSFLICGVAALAIGAASNAHAVSVVDATRIRVTNAIPTWLQVAEVVAIQFGTGVNVAAAANGGSAAGSGTYCCGADPSQAIDGDTTGVFANIYHSNGSSAAEFLDITFAGPRTLASLTIHGRDDSFSSRDLYNVTIYDATNTVLFSGQLDARTGAPNNNFATVRFDAPPTTTTPVPEPASWAMMILGFLGSGAVLRKARGRIAAAG